MLALDLYKSPIKFRTPDERDTYRSMPGMLLSCMTLTLVMGYATYKLFALIGLKDFSVQERNQFEYFHPKEMFGFDEGFNIAVAFAPFENDNLPIEDPAIG